MYGDARFPLPIGQTLESLGVYYCCNFERVNSDQKELAEITLDPLPPQLSAGPTKGYLTMMGSQLSRVPWVTFQFSIFIHCNINSQGVICLDILRILVSRPHFSKVLLSICSLLTDCIQMSSATNL
ncbi:ubiquitin-conjugating enzyme E2 E2-like [Penaeus chinensis]|uniref:ubiquitin-conjugating enzyme E2 E2-like n=1 Tax=Penaeus chinensis TaxID=139456 RepID=UPI001FB79502|nr:ubiquitin-conjugating enzyme E2 E2-like [Penaeus chinensis]